MESIVVDSSIIVASFLVDEERHQQALEYINGLEQGDYAFHLPMLAIIEVASAIRRRTIRNWIVLASTWKQNVADWERDGSLILYPLNRDRLELAVTIAQRDRLRGADSVVAALAEELDFPLKTFDNELLNRFPAASQ